MHIQGIENEILRTIKFIFTHVQYCIHFIYEQTDWMNKLYLNYPLKDLSSKYDIDADKSTQMLCPLLIR